MASAGKLTVNTGGVNVYDSAAGCAAFLVHCDAAASNPALVNIPGLHEAGEFFPLPVGFPMAFRYGYAGIKQVFVKGSGGDTIVNFGVIAKDPAPCDQSWTR